ncbi:hypothetical protein [Devosia sp. Naph2]|uniref:hypothetical protein n=1 Tax=Devosia polycyclovorans TaxID=3345148 RepID=UPI0035CEA6C1
MAENPLNSAKTLLSQLLNEKVKLTAERAALDKRATELDKLIHRVESLVAALQQVKSAQDTEARIRNDESAASENYALVHDLDPPARNPKKEEVAKVAREIIEEAGHPLNRGDLFQRLQSKGIDLQGANPQMVLSTMLWRAGEKAGIVRLKRSGGGYWLKERPWPDAGYDPESVFD